MNPTQKLILEVLASEELSSKRIEEELVTRGRSVVYDTVMRNLGRMVRSGQLSVRRGCEPDKLYLDNRHHWINYYKKSKDANQV